MNRYAPTTRQSLISQVRRGGRSRPVVESALELCSPPSIPSPKDRSFARQSTENDTRHRKMWFSQPLLLEPIHGKREQRVPLLSGTDGVLIGLPFSKSVFIESHFSRIFPAYPRSLARCLSRALRHIDVLLRLRRPAGLGFQTKISPTERARFFFGASAESTSRSWERGTLTSLRAGVSRGQSGQIQTGEIPWHSTKTKSP